MGGNFDDFHKLYDPLHKFLNLNFFRDYNSTIREQVSAGMFSKAAATLTGIPEETPEEITAKT
jgi:hypothetical protein